MARSLPRSGKRGSGYMFQCPSPLLMATILFVVLLAWPRMAEGKSTAVRPTGWQVSEFLRGGAAAAGGGHSDDSYGEDDEEEEEEEEGYDEDSEYSDDEEGGERGDYHQHQHSRRRPPPSSRGSENRGSGPRRSERDGQGDSQYTASKLATKTLSGLGKAAKGGVKGAVGIMKPKSVDFGDVTECTWKLEQTVALNGGKGREVQGAATIELRSDGSVITSYNGEEEVTHFTFKKHRWPRYCTIEFEARAWQGPRDAQPVMKLYKGWFTRSMVNSKLISLEGTIYEVQGSMLWKRQVKCGSFVAKKRPLPSTSRAPRGPARSRRGAREDNEYDEDDDDEDEDDDGRMGVAGRGRDRAESRGRGRRPNQGGGRGAAGDDYHHDDEDEEEDEDEEGDEDEAALERERRARARASRRGGAGRKR